MRKIIAVLVAIALIGALGAYAVNPVSANEPDTNPDYELEQNLPSDGSEDSSAEYSVTRDDGSSSGNIHIRAYIEEREIYITFENVRKVIVYFNETDINVDDYMPLINTVGTDIDIIVNSDVSLLDAEFHDVPKPDAVLLNGADWSEYSYEDRVFSFTDLEMSENTITLSYMGLLTDMIVEMVALFLLLLFVVYIIRMIKDEILGSLKT